MAAKFDVFFDEDHSKLTMFTGFLNLLNPLSQVLLLILAQGHVLQLSCV